MTTLIDKLKQMGFPESYAEQVYMFYVELNQNGRILDSEEREKNKDLFD